VERADLRVVERDAAAAKHLVRFRDLEVAVGDLFTGDRSSDAGLTIATDLGSRRSADRCG
jgi:hypothetical protein